MCTTFGGVVGMATTSLSAALAVPGVAKAAAATSKDNESLRNDMDAPPCFRPMRPDAQL
jgi:hypothetical protein